MALTVYILASLREAVGIAREQIDLPPDVATAGELRVWLRQREGVWARPSPRDGRSGWRSISGWAAPTRRWPTAPRLRSFPGDRWLTRPTGLRSRWPCSTADFDVSAEIAALRGADSRVGAVAAFIGTVRDVNDGAGVAGVTAWSTIRA